MAQGWDRWVKAPGGGVIAEFGGPDPSGRCAGLDILLWAETRAAALKRARSLGLHGVQLQSPGGVPNEDVEEMVASGRDMLWRRDDDPPEQWRTIDTWPGPTG